VPGQTATGEDNEKITFSTGDILTGVNNVLSIDKK